MIFLFEFSCFKISVRNQQFYIYQRRLMEKLFDAAQFIKAKLAQDELHSTLLHITSEQNWQPSTKQMHQIANAAYNYQKWHRINDFIWDKLKKSKSWRKILKSLILVQFLIKNGPPNVLSIYKHETMQFKRFANYVQVEQGTDRGQTIRQRAKKILQLLENQQILQQERTKARQIRDRMSNIVSQRGYGNISSRYGNPNQWKPRCQLSKKQQFQTNQSAFGDYNCKSSTLNKYKDSSKNLSTLNLHKTSSYQIKEKSEQKKPFENEVKKLQRSATSQILGLNINKQKSCTNLQEDLFQLDNFQQTKSFKKQKKEDLFIDLLENYGEKKEEEQFSEYERVKSPVQNLFTSIQPSNKTKQDDQFLPYQQTPALNRYHSEGNFMTGAYLQQQFNQVPQFNNGFISNQSQFNRQQFQVFNNNNKLNEPYGNISLLSVASTTKTQQDNQFSSFQPTSLHVKWMSATEKSLTDMTGFEDQIKVINSKKQQEKNKKQNIQMNLWNW